MLHYYFHRTLPTQAVYSHGTTQDPVQVVGNLTGSSAFVGGANSGNFPHIFAHSVNSPHILSKSERSRHPEQGSRHHHPGDSPGASRWFLKSTPIRMPFPGGGIGRLTLDLPLGCLQGELLFTRRCPEAPLCRATLLVSSEKLLHD